MRVFILIAVVASGILGLAAQTAKPANARCTLTIQAQGVNDEDGNIGVLVFNSGKGWAEDRTVALRDVVVPAHPGTVTVEVPGLPAGDYAVAIAHDVNKNHKLDRNWLGKPKEQWGMSNDPHATIKTPAFERAKFSLKGDMTITVKMQ
jgi:uncharacterized protein (DUF2141 family)